MRRSISRQMIIVFVGLIIFILVLLFAINSGFLEHYYAAHKQEDMLNMYNSVKESIEKGTIGDGAEIERLGRQTEEANISALVIRSDATVVFATVRDGNGPMYVKLLSYVFQKNANKIRVLERTESYQICKTKDFSNQTEYLEMWGGFPDDSLFIMQSPLESIRESAALANEFLVYMGILAVILGGALVWFFSKKITEPIKELAVLSQRMTNLDFEAKYTSGGDNEIGVLGRNFNSMSSRLEKTISELKGVNNCLQKNIEQKEKQEDMRNEFLGNVSHELKTPIALIQGYAEGLKEGVNKDLESREFYCDVIMDEAEKMNQMVKNLLILNQLEFGEKDLVFERFDIVGMIQGILASCEILIQQAEASVDFVVEEKAYVWADEFKTEQVIRNYLTNALHHVGNEMRVEIRVVSKGDVVRISVFNSGSPIPEEDLGKLWDKFYKVDKAHTREYGGNGIGLSIVKAIMESFHQKYGVTSFENGVEFWFELDTQSRSEAEVLEEQDLEVKEGTL